MKNLVIGTLAVVFCGFSTIGISQTSEITSKPPTKHLIKRSNVAVSKTVKKDSQPKRKVSTSKKKVKLIPLGEAKSIQKREKGKESIRVEQ